MEIGRSPFQGLQNVFRFNWHFYLLAGVSIVMLLISANYLGKPWSLLLYGVGILILITTLLSLLVTHYVYDLSELYEFKWLDEFSEKDNKKILNINAGFDETSLILTDKFRESELHICDFYNPKHHTEVSIKRARKAYPPNHNTKKVKTDYLPYSDNEFEMVCMTFAAHEIRNFEERQQFFKELKRVTKPDGKIFVTEHLRDIKNFLAYSIGFFHFYSRNSWMSVFQSSNLKLLQEQKTTSFVRTFILTPNGTAH